MVRPSGVEVPIGSLLRLIAVTVAVTAPVAALEGAAVKVRTAKPPMMVVLGENDAVTPLGRPLTLRATGVP
jgi:hypothetical protein